MVAGGHLKVGSRAAGANMSIDVQPGAAIVVGDDMVDQGKYLCRLHDPVNLEVAAAPGAGLSRIDLVIARVYDSSVTGDLDLWTVEVVTGVPAASPLEPPVPGSSYLLATFPVASGTAAITAALISDQRRMAASGRAFFQIVAAAPQPIAANVRTKLTTAWAAQPTLNVGGGIWANHTYTPPARGLYRVMLQVAFNAIGAFCEPGVRRASTGGELARSSTNMNVSITPTAMVQRTLLLDPNDGIEFTVLQSAAGNPSTHQSNLVTFAEVEQLPVAV